MSGRRGLPAGMRARLLARDLTPPLLWRALVDAKGRAVARAAPRRPRPAPRAVAAPPAPEPPGWEHVPEGWSRQRTDPRIAGWDVEGVVASYRAKWPSYLRALEGPKTLGVYHEVPAGAAVGNDDAAAHNTLVAYAYVLALAAAGRERISVLDWGGGPGHYLPLSEALLPGTAFDYHSKDVPSLAQLGRELLPRGTFWDDESCLERRYDLVLASGALQYSEAWEETLGGLAGATGRYLYVTRLPVALAGPSFVVVQRPYSVGYDTEYLGWVLNRDAVVDAADRCGLDLLREFIVQAEFSAAGAPEAPTGHRGFLFARRGA